MSTLTVGDGHGHPEPADLIELRPRHTNGVEHLPPLPPDPESLDALTTLRTAMDTLGEDRVAVAASFGPESIVILDLLAEIGARPHVITLDTGRLPQETHDLMDRVRERFDVHIEVFAPDPVVLTEMVSSHGTNLFRRSLADRMRCCDVRKVEPLQRALAGKAGWITGLRRDQNVTRAGIPKITRDIEHGLMWKICPLADWTADEVWARIRQRDLPYNRLHDEGYPSVGCAPCSRAVLPGEDPRSGRWWWEAPESRECGLHLDRASFGLPPTTMTG